MIDFALDGVLHDRFVLNGDLAVVSEGMEVAQNCKIRLLTIQGEDAFDFTIGIPWLFDMFDPMVSQTKKERYIRQTITETTGIKNLLLFDVTIDNDKKEIKVEYQADTIFGTINVEVIR